MKKIPLNFATIIKRTEARQALTLKAESDKEASAHEEKRRQEIEFVMRLVDRFCQSVETFIDLESIKKDNWDCYATARIPGLAPITLHFRMRHMGEGNIESSLEKFQVQRPRSSRYDDKNDHAYYSPHDYYSFKPSQYAETLVCAKDSGEHFQDLVESVEARNKANAERQEVLNAKATEKEKQVDALFEMVSNDPIIVTILRLFQLITLERENFEAELEEINYGFESNNHLYQSKVADLKQSIDQAEKKLIDANYEKQRLEDHIREIERQTR